MKLTYIFATSNAGSVVSTIPSVGLVMISFLIFDSPRSFPDLRLSSASLKDKCSKDISLFGGAYSVPKFLREIINLPDILGTFNHSSLML